MTLLVLIVLALCLWPSVLKAGDPPSAPIVVAAADLGVIPRFPEPVRKKHPATAYQHCSEAYRALKGLASVSQMSVDTKTCTLTLIYGKPAPPRAAKSK